MIKKTLRSFHIHLLLYGALSTLAFACGRTDNRSVDSTWEQIPVLYAEGFTLKKKEGAYWIEILSAFPNANRSYHYLVVHRDSTLSSPIENPQFDATVYLPVNQVAVTSTTHIPHLDLLGVSHYLGGFPGRNLISSAEQRKRIDANEIREIGTGASLNVESIVELHPDWIMLSTLGSDLQQISLLSNAGIPVILNGDYTERHPLGVAEWIKITGILTGTLAEASRQFDSIAENYHEAEKLVHNKNPMKKPTVMSGVLYNDVWYAPGSESWVSVLIEQAGGNYLFKETQGKGGLALSYEYILDRAQSADFWIGAADYPSRDALGKQDPKYRVFRPFQTDNIYTYTAKKGATGGLLYFELGYMRPDLVLKDLIKILHPDLLPDYDLFFYEKMNEY